MSEFMYDNKHKDLENLEATILRYELESDSKRKRLLYLKLIEECLKLVHKIVSSYFILPKTISRDDLIQVGAIGIIKAIETYKPNDNGSFKTYATIVVKGNISHYLRDSANIVKFPREYIENLTKVKHAIATIERTSDIEPTAKGISRITNLSAQKVEEILKFIEQTNIISLDQNAFQDSESETLLNSLETVDKSNFEEYYENKKILEFAINKLPETEKSMIKMYYFNDILKKDIAKQFNVSQTQVSRILKKALNKLFIIISKEIS